MIVCTSTCNWGTEGKLSLFCDINEVTELGRNHITINGLKINYGERF